MKNKYLIPIIICFILALIAYFLFINYETLSIERIFNFTNDFLDIISPIGIFFLTYFGLRTWKDEIIGKRDLRLVEELFLAFNTFVNKFKAIRNSWPYFNVIPSRENQQKNFDIQFGFNMDEANQKFDEADKYKDLLINKIEEVERILGEDLVPSIQDLLELYEYYHDATSDIYLFNQQGEDGGKFSIDSIMKIDSLQLVVNYRYPIKGVSVEELNKKFNDRLNSSIETFRRRINHILS